MRRGLWKAGAMTILLTAALLGACDGGGDGGDEARAAPAPAPVVPVRTVRSYPHDPEAYTQGLLFHEGRLYESTGRYGQSSLREVALETGEVLRKVDLPQQYFAEGLTLLDGRLYQLTWQQGMGFVYGLDDFRQTGTFAYDGEGWGLATDGRQLVLSDGSNRLRFIDPATSQVERTLEVMDGPDYVHQLNELEWVRGEVWANVWHSSRIARINPQTGRVVGWLDLSGVLPSQPLADPEAVLNGIAYDAAADRIYVTGKLWPTIFEIDVPGLIGGGARPASGAVAEGARAPSAG
ncbi:MAG TPA: glutaminyl-peptide cyclotransferase, partial [Longimicrobium sp.]|nr:glutaminyl-peptide cyclotransferase [Longimicrobium sp.]